MNNTLADFIVKFHNDTTAWERDQRWEADGISINDLCDATMYLIARQGGLSAMNLAVGLGRPIANVRITLQRLADIGWAIHTAEGWAITSLARESLGVAGVRGAPDDGAAERS